MILFDSDGTGRVSGFVSCSKLSKLIFSCQKIGAVIHSVKESNYSDTNNSVSDHEQRTKCVLGVLSAGASQAVLRESQSL